MPDAESREAGNTIAADPASVSTPEGAKPPDRSAPENDSGITSRSIAIPRGQSITDCAGNSLVTRGLQDIAELRAREEELSADLAAAEKAADIALEEFVALLIKKGLISDPEPESTAAESPEPAPPPPASPADPSPDWCREQT